MDGAIKNIERSPGNVQSGPAGVGDFEADTECRSGCNGCGQSALLKLKAVAHVVLEGGVATAADM